MDYGTQAPLSMGFPGQEYWMEWIAVIFSMASSNVSCIGRQITTEPSGKAY